MINMVTWYQYCACPELQLMCFYRCHVEATHPMTVLQSAKGEEDILDFSIAKERYAGVDSLTQTTAC